MCYITRCEDTKVYDSKCLHQKIFNSFLYKNLYNFKFLIEYKKIVLSRYKKIDS